MRLLVICYALLCVGVFGNGGGYHYGIKFTGGISPFSAEGVENVQIIDEKLDIHLLPNHATVQVRYLLKNISDQSASVKFGFPVEEVDNHWSVPLPLGDKPKEEERVSSYTKNYKVSLRGKELASKYVYEPYAKGEVKAFEGDDVLKGIKGWMVSKMRLKANESVVMEISYDSDYDCEGHSVSEDSTDGPWNFKYRLSSGGVWNGSIKEGRVTIHNAGVDPSHICVLKPTNRFKKEGNTLVWRFSNLEPSLNDDIEVIARESIGSFPVGYSDEVSENTDKRYYRMGGRFYLAHWEYSAEASSELKSEAGFNYGVLNINPSFYEEGHDTWSEGVEGDGVGESITITLDKPSEVTHLLVNNGYIKSFEEAGQSFTNNNRVKSVRLTINGTNEINGLLFDHPFEQLVSLGGFAGNVETIKIQIDSVYKGEKYQDTCLSGIELLKRLTNEPKQYGSR
ncbi:NADase-type glycan-binding domain-containing protein [Rubritalea sp.]|uniref:NADase-type glycan-binding domain-containing protein n=1 Tax=Rubritalea sp. TaxID=2109375 RepID=UPI003EF47037